MTFGHRVSTIRKQRNLNQVELGELIDTSANVISKYERDFIKPSIDVASKIAKVLNVSIDYLVNGINPAAKPITLDEANKLRQFDQLPAEDKAHLLAVLDAFLTKAKLQSLHG
ncbi:helix-turn-helix domain-containing protein [Chitinophaga vietnamensis]|uniref:helix-turn-helix domain-containing protein n=1 Tax=Chitinophaga vietnamensis TaxID=2593957 RepID=UPI0011786E30|nr:helix-turn-helix transcriptional regulator [Chitinophaga vietnamensis]